MTKQLGNKNSMQTKNLMRKILPNTTNLYEVLVHAMTVSLDPFYPAKDLKEKRTFKWLGEEIFSFIRTSIHSLSNIFACVVKLHVTEESKGEKWKINYKLSVSDKISMQNFIAAMKFKKYMIGENQSNAFCIMARHGNSTGFALPILAPYSQNYPYPLLPTLFSIFRHTLTCSLVCPSHWFYPHTKTPFLKKISMTQAVKHQLQAGKIWESRIPQWNQNAILRSSMGDEAMYSLFKNIREMSMGGESRTLNIFLELQNYLVEVGSGISNPPAPVGSAFFFAMPTNNLSI